MGTGNGRTGGVMMGYRTGNGDMGQWGYGDGSIGNGGIVQKPCGASSNDTC